MTTLPTISQTQFLTEIRDLEADVIPLNKIAFFREQLKHELHELVLKKFLALQDSHRGFTKADLARRIGRRPEQVTRWLGAPGNLTIDTVSDLLIGMAAVLKSTVIDIEALIREPEPERSVLMTPSARAGLSKDPTQPSIVMPPLSSSTPSSDRARSGIRP